MPTSACSSKSKGQAPDQVANVAFLPGIQYASLAMPDIHWGYGFCIGGVCATDPDEGGVISAGRCWLRHQLRRPPARSNLFYRDVKPHLRTLVEELFRQVPTGVGKSGRFTFKGKELASFSVKVRAIWCSTVWRPRAILSTPKRAAASTAPTRRGERPRPDARRRAVRHARLGKSFPLKYRSSITSSMKMQPRSWVWKRT